MNKRFLAFAVAIAISSPAFAQSADNDVMDLSTVVANVESSTSSHAMEAEIDSHKGQLAYEIDLVNGEKISTVYVDARTGETIATEEPRIENIWRKVFDRELKMFREINQPLAARIATIETEMNGKVREVEFDIEDDMPIWEVEVATASGTAELKIDAKTGNRLETDFDD